MNNYGTWTTIDCPTKQIEEAFKLLKEEFDKIDGDVRKIYNSHDFGSYPSFEIDKPDKFSDIDYIDEDYPSHEDAILLDDWDEWRDKANEIEEKYNKKFINYL